MPLDLEEELRTYYIPEEETRHLKFMDGWWADDNGVLLAPCKVKEADSDDPVLLKQFGAHRLIRTLTSSEIDPSDWVRVSRFEDGGFMVKQEDMDVSEAM